MNFKDFLNTYQQSTLRIVRVNNKSVVFHCEATDQIYLATQKVANIILNHTDILVMVVEKPYNNDMQQWLAVPSIFG